MAINEISSEEMVWHDVTIHNNQSLVPLLEKIEEKEEKHKQNALDLLSNLLSPFHAFKNGFEKAIASFIKFGSEGKVTQELVLGPQAKTTETAQIELIIKSLLNDFNSAKFIQHQDKYLVICQGKTYDLAQILKGVNFNHVTLTKAELHAYHLLLDKNILSIGPDLDGKRPTSHDFLKADPKNLCIDLELGEKEAINIYTGESYESMNHLMRGNIQGCVFQSSVYALNQKERVNAVLKETLLHVAVTVSGLNKLPDYQAPVGLDGTPKKYIYRGEDSIPKAILAERKWAVQEGGKVTWEMGFLSTAFNKPASGFFNEYAQNGIMFKNVKGKKITPLSQFGKDEREILLPPTQVQWLYHKEITVNKMHKINLFIAKPVTVPTENPTIENIKAKAAYLAKYFSPSEWQDWAISGLKEWV